jgi:hypothetical protein
LPLVSVVPARTSILISSWSMYRDFNELARDRLLPCSRLVLHSVR